MLYMIIAPSNTTPAPALLPALQNETESAPNLVTFGAWRFPNFILDIKVGAHNQTLPSEGASPAYFAGPLLRNNAVESAAIGNYKSLKSPSQHTAVHVNAQVKERWNVDVDPEKTYLITFAYNKYTTPHKAVITQKMSLADAARLNVQGTQRPPNMSFKHEARSNTPSTSFEVQPYSLHTSAPGENGTFKTSNAGTFNEYYTGIYTEPSADAPDTYGKDQLQPIPPKAFKEMVKVHAYKKPYDEYLSFYWSHNDTRESYTKLNKLAYMKSAHIQHHEQSLDEEGRKIAMHLAGVPPNQSYMDFNGSTLNKPYVAAPNLETRFLTFVGSRSTNIFYTRDINTQKTVLFIPGNSSPLHTFESPGAMNKWLANELRDEDKANVFRQHFSPKDLSSSLLHRGFDDQLKVIRARIKDPGAVEYFETQDYWKEGDVFGGDKVEGDPFKELQKRTENVMKVSTSDQFVLNSDLTKKTLIKALKILDTGLLFLTPLGVIFPPVGILLTGLSVTSGAIKTGIGIDDKVHGRPGATDRITFGVFSAIKPILTAGLGKALPPVGGVLKTIILKP